jgi:hypothetical protein
MYAIQLWCYGYLGDIEANPLWRFVTNNDAILLYHTEEEAIDKANRKYYAAVKEAERESGF